MYHSTRGVELKEEWAHNTHILYALHDDNIILLVYSTYAQNILHMKKEGVEMGPH